MILSRFMSYLSLFFRKGQRNMEWKITISQQDVDKYNKKYFAEHPKAKKPKIKSPQHPSLNWYMTANNLEMNVTKQAWKDFIVFILQNNDLIDMQIDKCTILYRTYFKTRHKHDLDNITPKFILDGFTEGGFIVADDSNHIVQLTTECGYDPINPRIELYIKQL